MRLTLRLQAESCRPWDVVPWQQMGDAAALPKADRRAFLRHTGYKIPPAAELVRFDTRRIFARQNDLAVCVYDYDRDFSPARINA